MMMLDRTSAYRSVLLVCDRTAIPPEDRKRYTELCSRLAESVSSVNELQTGYAFKFRSGHITWEEIYEWIELERKCCPWIAIRTEQVVARTIEIHMSIPEHAKQAFRVEFSDWLRTQKP